MTKVQSPANFWTWSLDHYARKGVSATLLQLQDEAGLNVNLALWCLWCGRDFEEAPEIVLRKAIDLTSRWSADLAAKLRDVRRALKTPPRQADEDKARALRDLVKKAELNAEEIEQEMLENLARDQLQPISAPTSDSTSSNEAEAHKTRARRNLVNYAALGGASRHHGFSVSQLERLIESVFANAEPQATQQATSQ